MKIFVVAGLIVLENRVLIARRQHRDFNGLWEFPGGKRELDESDVNCLIREIKEELDLEISVRNQLATVNYNYEKFDVEINFYFASILQGICKLKVHSEIKFVKPNHLLRYEFLPSNIEVIRKLQLLNGFDG